MTALQYILQVCLWIYYECPGCSAPEYIWKEQVSKFCKILYHPCSTWHFVPGLRTALKKPPHPFLFITTACPLFATPRFLHQLICPLRAPTPTYYMRWKDHWTNRKLMCVSQKKDKSLESQPTYLFSYILLSLSLLRSWSLMMDDYYLLYKPDIYLMWLHLMC